MRFYHVSDMSQSELQKVERRKLFVPRVPADLSEELDEDKVTPRVCLSTSVSKCLQAINFDVGVGKPITVFAIDLNKDNPALIFPEDLARTGRVRDAIENQEYWYTQPLEMRGASYVITKYRTEPTIAWSALRSEDVLGIARDAAEELCITDEFDWGCLDGLDAKGIYENITEQNDLLISFEANRSSVFEDDSVYCSFEDKLYDCVVELDWAQLLRITDVSIEMPKARYGVVKWGASGIKNPEASVEYFQNENDCLAAVKGERTTAWDYFEFKKYDKVLCEWCTDF